ncbi:MAG: DUF2007 domain-containing protein [Armatimonadetes bacterium]|nr:DUF2007 domain-containing protein [Armatimonadota bacterium]
MNRSERHDPLTLVPVRTVTHPIEAEAIKGMLDSNGIPALLQSPTVTNTFVRGVFAGPLAEIRIMVPEERAEEAENLLRAMENSAPAEGVPRPNAEVEGKPKARIRPRRKNPPSSDEA